MRLRNGLSFSKIAIFHFVKKNGKIFAQPYPTKCIQFLDRENNDKNNTLPLGKQICSLRQCIVFVIVFSIQELNALCRMGLCGNFTRNETVYIPFCLSFPLSNFLRKLLKGINEKAPFRFETGTECHDHPREIFGVVGKIA